MQTIFILTLILTIIQIISLFKRGKITQICSYYYIGEKTLLGDLFYSVYKYKENISKDLFEIKDEEVFPIFINLILIFLLIYVITFISILLFPISMFYLLYILLIIKKK